MLELLFEDHNGADGFVECQKILEMLALLGTVQVFTVL
jgi:hypothetical protein